MTETEVFAE